MIYTLTIKTAVGSATDTFHTVDDMLLAIRTLIDLQTIISITVTHTPSPPLINGLPL